MLPYILLLVIPILVALPIKTEDATLLMSVQKKRSNDRIVMAFFVLLFLLVVFRSESIGADTLQYKYHFMQISQIPWSGVVDYGYEVGFTALYKLLSCISDDFRLVIVVNAVLGLVPIAVLYKNVSGNGLLKLSFLLFSGIICGYFTSFRQALAVAIIALSYSLIKKKKLLSFLIMIFLAMQFHRTAFVAFILYPAYHFKMKRKYLPIVGILMALVYILKTQLFSIAMSIVDSKTAELYSDISTTGAYRLLLLFVLLLLFCFLITKESKTDKETKGMLNIFIVATFIQIFASIIHVVDRINMYFIIFMPLAIAKSFEAASPRYKEIVQLAEVVCVAFFFLYFLYNLANNANLQYASIYEYKFLWE